jgi:hypothetical protein
MDIKIEMAGNLFEIELKHGDVSVRVYSPEIVKGIVLAHQKWLNFYVNVYKPQYTK